MFPEHFLELYALLYHILGIHIFQESDNLWWDAFATEFFEDEATLTLTFCLEDGPKRYSKYYFSIIKYVRIICLINLGIFFLIPVSDSLFLHKTIAEKCFDFQ
jgi:LIM domain-binding protein 1